MMTGKVTEQTESVLGRGSFRKISSDEEQEDRKKYLQPNKKDTARTREREERKRSEEDESTDITTREEASDKSEEGPDQDQGIVTRNRMAYEENLQRVKKPKSKAPPRPSRPPQIQVGTERNAGSSDRGQMTAATGALHITPSEEAEKKENLELTPQQAVYAGSESEVEQLRQEIRKKELEWKEQEEEFEREKKRLRQEIKTLSEENDALKMTMKRNKTLIEEQDDEKNHMDTLVRRKTREIETLKEDFGSKEEEFLNLEKELKKEIKNQKKENKNQGEKIEDLERNVQKQKHEHTMTVEKLKFDHEKKWKELSKESNSKGRELEALTRKNRQTEDEKKQQEKESQKELKKLKDGIKKLEDDKSSLSKDLQKKDAQVRSQESKIDDLKETKNKQDQSLKSATEQIERGRREVQHLKNRLAQEEADNTRLSTDRLSLARAFLQTDDHRAALHNHHLEDTIQLEILRSQLEDLKTEKFFNLLQNVKRGKYLGNIVSPPGQVSALHTKIVSELTAAAGNSLQQSAEAPALVTSVNTSRVVADIKRDLGRVSGLKTERIMVLIIKGSSEESVKQSVSVQEIGDKRVVQARYVLVDPGFKRVLKCQYNKDTYQTILQFFKN